MINIYSFTNEIPENERIPVTEQLSGTKGPLAEDGNHWFLNCGDFNVDILCVEAGGCQV